MRHHLIQPGDATVYTIVYGITTKTETPHWPYLFFAFGSGDRHGQWMQFPMFDMPSFSFAYFADSLGMNAKKDFHTCQVAFTIFLHIVGQKRFQSDTWKRESELNWSFLESLPNLTHLMEAFRGNQEH